MLGNLCFQHNAAIHRSFAVEFIKIYIHTYVHNLFETLRKAFQLKFTSLQLRISMLQVIVYKVMILPICTNWYIQEVT